MRKQERIEEPRDRARRFGRDDFRQADVEPCGDCAITEPERAEVEFDVTEKLHEAHELVRYAVEYRVDQARDDLAIAEVEAAHEELELREPATRGRIHE